MEQEARRRLGVMAEGESAWRIIDPRMSHSPSITTDEVPDERSWSEVMWDSLRELPESDVPAPEPAEQPQQPAEPEVPEAPQDAEPPAEDPNPGAAQLQAPAE